MGVDREELRLCLLGERQRRGKGSSREQSPYAECRRNPGRDAENIERIYKQNCQNPWVAEKLPPTFL